jgi:hypothetical protein
MSDDLEKQFDYEMLKLYRTMNKEAGFRSEKFLHMVGQNGGLDTAHTLLHAQDVSEGFKFLCERGRLDLTVEAFVIRPEWKELFTDEELAIARERLKKWGYANC